MAQVKTKVLTARVPFPLTEKIDQEEERSRVTRDALADVDAGHVIDHQAVQAWTDSLSTDTPLPAPRRPVSW